MLHYVGEQQDCRSTMIGSYFGDSSLSDCGICDNCLAKKQTPLAATEFSQLQERIITLLKSTPLSTTALLKQLEGIQKEKARQVIDYLQAEEKISIDAQGKIRLV